MWWLTPVIPALGFLEFKACLGSLVNSRTAGVKERGWGGSGS